MLSSATPLIHRGATFAIIGGVALVVIATLNVRDAVLYNPSPSVSVGFYARVDAQIALGAMVTVRALDVAPAYAAARDFTDPSDRFIKRVAAADGDEICAEGALVSINGAPAAERLAHDSAGRPLPTWSGCHVLGADEVLLMGDTPDSFDGRYWGAISIQEIEGVWRPIARRSA